MTDRRANYYARERFEERRKDLSGRLARACAHFTQSDFAELVAGMTRLQLRFDGVTAAPATASPRSGHAVDR